MIVRRWPPATPAAVRAALVEARDRGVLVDARARRRRDGLVTVTVVLAPPQPQPHFPGVAARSRGAWRWWLAVAAGGLVAVALAVGCWWAAQALPAPGLPDVDVRGPLTGLLGVAALFAGARWLLGR